MVDVKPVVRPSIKDSVEDYIKIVVEKQPIERVKGDRMLMNTSFNVMEKKSLNFGLPKIDEEEEDTLEPN